MTSIRKNPQVQAIVEELEKFSIPYRIEITGSNHIKVRWNFNSVPRWCLAAGSPSEYRGVKNSRSRVKRMLREDGFSV